MGFLDRLGARYRIGTRIYTGFGLVLAILLGQRMMAQLGEVADAALAAGDMASAAYLGVAQRQVMQGASTRCVS